MKIRKFHRSLLDGSKNPFECDETQINTDCQIPEEEIIRVTISWEDGGDQIVIDRPPNPKVRVYPVRDGKHFIHEFNTPDGEYDLYEADMERAVRVKGLSRRPTFLSVFPATYEDGG